MFFYVASRGHFSDNPKLTYLKGAPFALRLTSLWYPRQESNLYLGFRKPPFYPLNYEDLSDPILLFYSLSFKPLEKYYPSTGIARLRRVGNPRLNPLNYEDLLPCNTGLAPKLHFLEQNINSLIFRQIRFRFDDKTFFGFNHL